MSPTCTVSVLAAVAIRHATSDATFYTWRRKFGGMEVPKVKLKSLEEDNARLRKLLAGAMLDEEALQVALGRKF